MTRTTKSAWRLLLPVVMVALSLVLLATALQTFRELNEQKAVYLRNRVALLAGRLENLPKSETEGEAFDLLSQEEPDLIDLKLIERGKAGDEPLLEPIWNGRELFRTQFLGEGQQRIYRAYVPFHSGASLRIARIDLDAAAADFLVVHARHNVIAASLGGAVLVALALYAVWAARRAARLELRQLELEHLAHIGKMAAVLAHEIRNPLGTIKGFAQLLGEQAGAQEHGLVEPILNETGRLENLVNDLLLYGRPPAPAMRHAKWEETLAPLQAHAQRMIGTREIRFVPDTPPLTWETDPGLLQEALLNLVRNAVEAIGDSPGGEIKLELKRHNRAGITLSIIDNGPGVPEDAQPRLFEPFFTTKPFGTGLGLSITRKLIESLGGELTLGPAEPHGSIAVVRFPNVSAAESGVEA